MDIDFAMDVLAADFLPDDVNDSDDTVAGFHEWPCGGSFEVFRFTRGPRMGLIPPMESGWYWQACFPGCLPDGDPFGPFDSALAAYVSAMLDS